MEPPPDVQVALEKWGQQKIMHDLVTQDEPDHRDGSVDRRIARLGVLRATLIEQLVGIDEELEMLLAKGAE